MNMGVLIVVFIFLIPFSSYAQEYKSWFLNQSEVNCIAYSVGYAEHSYYQDTTAIKDAFVNACENFVRNKLEKVRGGEASWATEIGTFGMGNNLLESYDTSSVSYYEHTFKILDTLSDNNIIAVLAGDKGCSPGAAIKYQLSATKKPTWAETPPRSKQYYYTVGIAQGYYTEKSSWIEAEKSARLKLASSVSVYIEALQLMNSFSGQSIENQNINVVLSNITVVSRWHDQRNDFYYVLLRMPK